MKFLLLKLTYNITEIYQNIQRIIYYLSIYNSPVILPSAMFESWQLNHIIGLACSYNYCTTQIFLHREDLFRTFKRNWLSNIVMWNANRHVKSFKTSATVLIPNNLWAFLYGKKTLQNSNIYSVQLKWCPDSKYFIKYDENMNW